MPDVWPNPHGQLPPVRHAVIQREGAAKPGADTGSKRLYVREMAAGGNRPASIFQPACIQAVWCRKGARTAWQNPTPMSCSPCAELPWTRMVKLGSVPRCGTGIARSLSSDGASVGPSTSTSGWPNSTLTRGLITAALRPKASPLNHSIRLAVPRSGWTPRVGGRPRGGPSADRAGEWRTDRCRPSCCVGCHHPPAGDLYRA